MTLIVGVVCADGVVLCADSQETIGGLKTERNKVPIHDGPAAQVVVGGAGEAELSDVLIPKIVEKLTRRHLSSASAARTAIEDVLVQFHSSSVFTAFPGGENGKYLAGLIVIRPKRERAAWLFQYLATAVRPVEKFKLAGEEYAHFEHAADRLYHDGITTMRAVALGLEVLSVASTSLYVGGRSRVVVATSADIVEQNADAIALLEGQIAEKNKVFDAITLDTADFKFSNVEYRRKLDQFCNSITAVRHIYGSKFAPWPEATLEEFGEIEKPKRDDEQ